MKRSLLLILLCSSLALWGGGNSEKDPDPDFMPEGITIRDDWLRWRGTSGLGLVEEADFDPAKLSDEKSVLWTIEVGWGYSSPAIKGNRLYVMGNDGEEEIIQCYNSFNGIPVWEYRYPCRRLEYKGPRATPFIDGERVYFVGSRGQIFSFSLEGELIWERDLVSELDIGIARWGIAGSAIVEGDMLLVNAERGGLALDKNSGAILWRGNGTATGYSSPVLFMYRETLCNALFAAREFLVSRVSDGEIIMSYDWITSYDVNAADPLVLDERIFISSGYSKGCAMLDISSGNPRLVWQNRELRSHFGSFYELNGHIYGIHGQADSSRFGELRCMQADTGELVWKERTGFGSLIMLNGILVFLKDSGEVVAVAPSPEGYQEISRGTIPKSIYWTPPSFSSGLLYLRGQTGLLVCMDVRS